jgi:hypothetical protein
LRFAGPLPATIGIFVKSSTSKTSGTRHKWLELEPLFMSGQQVRNAVHLGAEFDEAEGLLALRGDRDHPPRIHDRERRREQHLVASALILGNHTVVS